MKTRFVAVMLTRRCNMACTHCSVESHPKLKLQPSEDEVRRRVKALVAAGVNAFQFTGGEPLLRQSLLLEVLELARDAGAACAVLSGVALAPPETATAPPTRARQETAAARVRLPVRAMRGREGWLMCRAPIDSDERGVAG